MIEMITIMTIVTACMVAMIMRDNRKKVRITINKTKNKNCATIK